MPTFPSGADDDAFNGLSWAPPNIMFCWAAGCWPPPTMTTMPATMVVCRAGLGWADHRSRRFRARSAPGCLSRASTPWRCSGRFPFAARWHDGTQRRSGRSGCKSQRPPTPPRTSTEKQGEPSDPSPSPARTSPAQNQPRASVERAARQRRATALLPRPGRASNAAPAARCGPPEAVDALIAVLPWYTNNKDQRHGQGLRRQRPGGPRGGQPPELPVEFAVEIDHNTPDEELPRRFRVTCDREG